MKDSWLLLIKKNYEMDEFFALWLLLPGNVVYKVLYVVFFFGGGGGRGGREVFPQHIKSITLKKWGICGK